MTFNTWIDTFLEEKGIDQDHLLTVKGKSGDNIMPLQVLVDAMKQASPEEQKSLKGMLVTIDFKTPGKKPVLDYLEHLGQAIAI